MKENGLDAPYKFEKKNSAWWFSLNFSPVDQVEMPFIFLFLELLGPFSMTRICGRVNYLLVKSIFHAMTIGANEAL